METKIKNHKSILLKIFYRLKKYWMIFALWLGRINTIVLLSLIYFLVVGPMAIVVKLLRKDLLQKKILTKTDTYWQTRQSTPEIIDYHKYQF